jgi:peptidyl-prolyl cis-trans isomerase C
MRAFFPALLLCLSAAWAQQTFPLPSGPTPTGPPALPNLPDNAVIAVFDDGTKFTMGELKEIFDVLPPEARQNALVQQDMFVKQWALMRKLALMAEKDGLDKQNPAKTEINYSRLMVLSQVKLANMLNSNIPSIEEIEKYYQANRDRYKQVKAKAIYIAFGDAVQPGKKPLTEAEAKDKADKLLAQIRNGAEFVKLVKENSDDEMSREKDGDFATFHPRDNIPDAIRQAVFALKQGETTDPVHQANGFYLIRADEVSYGSLDNVRSELVSEMQQAQYTKWLAETNNSLKVEFPNHAFPAGAAPAK